MDFATSRWAEEIVHAAGLQDAGDVQQELIDTLVDRASVLSDIVNVSGKQAVQMIAATLPMDIVAECRLTERLRVTAEEVRDMFQAVSQAAWEFGEIDGLGAYRH